LQLLPSLYCKHCNVLAQPGVCRVVWRLECCRLPEIWPIQAGVNLSHTWRPHAPPGSAGPGWLTLVAGLAPLQLPPDRSHIHARATIYFIPIVQAWRPSFAGPPLLTFLRAQCRVRSVPLIFPPSSSPLSSTGVGGWVLKNAASHSTRCLSALSVRRVGAALRNQLRRALRVASRQGVAAPTFSLLQTL
jgi:hypothetical protein